MNQAMPDRASVTLVILAGGEGRRMGGADKGLALFRGRPLIEHVIERVGPQTADIVISANRNHAQYARYAASPTADLRSGFCGPLAGIEAALSRVSTPWALVVPCDVPGLPTDLLPRLAAGCRANLQKNAPCAAVASSGGRRHAVFLFPLSSKEVVTHLLDAGERRLQALFDALSAQSVDFDDCPMAFANLNSISDLQQD